MTIEAHWRYRLRAENTLTSSQGDASRENSCCGAQPWPSLLLDLFLLLCVLYIQYAQIPTKLANLRAFTSGPPTSSRLASRSKVCGGYGHETSRAIKVQANYSAPPPIMDDAYSPPSCGGRR
eukprot:3355268-Rhodomonas_salina.1